MANEFVARKGIISLGGLTFPYEAVPTNYTAGTDDYFIDIVSAGVTVTLPTAIGIEGKQYAIRNSSTSAATVNTVLSQTIDGNLTQIIGRNNILQVVSNNSGWKISQSSGSISGSTLNGVLVSDGTVSGVKANSGLTFDGQTLAVKTPQTSGDPYFESYSYTYPGTLTASTTGFSLNNVVFTYPLENLNFIDMEYIIERDNSAKKIAGFKKYSVNTGNTISVTYGPTVNLGTGATTSINSEIRASADSTNMYVYLRNSQNSAPAEIIPTIRINVRVSKY